MLRQREKESLELIESFLKGNDEAFSKIALLIHQDVLNISYRYVGNVEDAKDVLQEVLLKIHNKLIYFKKESKFSTWIYRITINASLDFLRKRKRSWCLKGRYLKNELTTTSLRDDIDIRDKGVIMKKAIEELSLGQKNVFILRHYKGLKIAEISKVLGCSQSSVKTQLKRGIDKIREKIGGLL
ncbi:MAG: RNA polymerase sigma factor [Candidatus Omnitrophica bacterium]|nr:RNA polymerase sigma factor [Candidatus Omnitrophota bacterium]